MPYVPQTPESYAAKIGRADSRNPATTCRGISVSTGKACRRGIKPSYASTDGITTQVPIEHFFCFQHKDQAKDVILLEPSMQQKERRLKGKTSLDTLVELVVGPQKEDGSVLLQRTSSIDSLRSMVVRKNSMVKKGGDSKLRYLSSGHSQPGAGKSKLPKPPIRQETSLDTVVEQSGEGTNYPRKPVKVLKYTRPSLLEQLFCCIRPQPYYVSRPSNDENIAASISRPARYAQHEDKSKTHIRFNEVELTKKRQPTKVVPSKVQSSQQQTRLEPPITQVPLAPTATAKRSDRSQNLNRPQLPLDLSRETRRRLTYELSQPISHKDKDGYIYIFWLKEGLKNANALDLETSHNMLKAELKRKGIDETIYLKIGRAENVQRRLHQWSKQCSYDPMLFRYYPHYSTYPAPDLSKYPLSSTHDQNHPNVITAAKQRIRRVPFSHRVEKLIHIELRDTYYQQPHRCAACNHTHREWFSVPASAAGLRKVDEVVKRWVAWAEGVRDMMEEAGQLNDDDSTLSEDYDSDSLSETDDEEDSSNSESNDSETDSSDDESDNDSDVDVQFRGFSKTHVSSPLRMRKQTVPNQPRSPPDVDYSGRPEKLVLHGYY